MNRRHAVPEAGFTLIELLMAMAVFSFMLLLIIAGFMNVIRMHNAAVASNFVQDSARGAMDELVMAVRNSGGVLTVAPGEICLDSTSGQPQVYYLVGTTLTRADGCDDKLNAQPITGSNVMVSNFAPVWENSATPNAKSKVKFSLTMGSKNGTTENSGAALSCGPSNSDRSFCAVVTLTSGAVQR